MEKNIELLDNPGQTCKAECGCSEKRFRFFVEGPVHPEEIFEVRYWLRLARNPKCTKSHRTDKPRVYKVVPITSTEEILHKITA